MPAEELLKDLCNTVDGPYLRPFVPNPHWSTAQVLVVGTNPATPMREEFCDFENYWAALTADVERFEAIYTTKHSAGASKTTQRARKLVQELQPLNVLVTNSMIYPASRPKDIPDRAHQRRVGRKCFDLLFRTSKPKVALFHGSEAVRLGQNYFGINLDPYRPIGEQSWVGNSCVSLFAFPHFSGQGVQKGYRVSEMDRELGLFARLAKKHIDAA